MRGQMASGGASRKRALVEYLDGIGDGDAGSKVYRFQVLLPNGTSTRLTLRDPGDEMLVDEFVHNIRRVVQKAPRCGERRQIRWTGDVYLEDLLDRKITKKIKFNDFDTRSSHILRLHDGIGDSVNTFQNMWDLTPQTDLLEELPAEYNAESALADLIDNSLQALWSNGEGERRLIRVTVDKEKIVIFDSGMGMDGSDEKSISKWGIMGSSNNRVFRAKGIGGKAPYLVPFFGMFGYGGMVASMHLGRSAIVSSKTKESSKVFTLHLSREVLRKKCTWKTAGGIRDPSNEEIRLSPHQSFTQVEIHGLNKQFDAVTLQYFLKDIYFPYIQYDEDNKSTSTRRPVQFQVNGVNLAEIEGGEVAITNLHSSNGPDFVLQLRFSQNSQTSSGPAQAHARLKCVYFPIVKGKESIASILEKLSKDGCGIKENFDNFSHVSIRRLGRLLPDARYNLLPFMEPKQKKGHKAELLKRCSKRVKCFIETDAGFYPTFSKTDLAHHHPFTKALCCLGSNFVEVEEMNVDVRKDGKLLSALQMEKQYQDWLMLMHDSYDEEMDGGDDEPTLIVNPGNKERLGISKDVNVIRVHKAICRKGKPWTSGDRLKILPGVRGRMKKNFYAMKTNFYATLEYVVVEGFQGDVCGEARLICRPVECSVEQGCKLKETKGGVSLDIQESVSFPISIIDDGKCQLIDEDTWNQMLEKKKEKAPGSIDVLRSLHCNAPGNGGDLQFEDVVMAGCYYPNEIIAVIRPESYTAHCSMTSLDQRYILKDDELVMVMEIMYFPDGKDCSSGVSIIRMQKKPSSHNGTHGLYIFLLKKHWSIFLKSGVYHFIFSVRCKDSRRLKHKSEITICPDSKTGSWRLFNVAGCHAENSPVYVRLGISVNCLAVGCVDSYGNRIPVVRIPEASITVLHGEYVLAQIDEVKMELASDSLSLKVLDIVVKSTKLDILRPKYEANMKIHSWDNQFCAIFPCKVMPGLPSTIKMEMSPDWEKNLAPGRVIENALLEVFDPYNNHVEDGIEVNVHLDGLCFLDKMGNVRKVDSKGFVDLGGILRVVGSFGSEVHLSIFRQEAEIFSRTFKVPNRELKAVGVPESCPAGSFLENIIFEVFDSDGIIDETIDGPIHTLSIRSDELRLVVGVQYTFKHGRCVIPHVPIPHETHEPGILSFVAYHTYYPDLQTRIELFVTQALDLLLTSMEDESQPFLGNLIPFVPAPKLLLSSEAASGQTDHFGACVRAVMENITQDIEEICSKIGDQERRIKALDDNKKSLIHHIFNLKDDIGPSIGSFISAKELTSRQIEENFDTAAALLCNFSNAEDCEPRDFMDGFIGIVALLGTLQESKVSRMLSLYLGEDYMLAVVCKNLQVAANYFEKYDIDGNIDVHFGIHQAATALGVHINRRFHIICIDAIKPYKGGFLSDTLQRKLVLPDPFPPSRKPVGFCGFAVNMINLPAKFLKITTSQGCGLRETLFYRLFGELQVYQTRKDMLEAIHYLKDGAISLDGGVIKPNGIMLLGDCDPKITFPVVSPGVHDELCRDSGHVIKKIKLMDAKNQLLKTIENKLEQESEARDKLLAKLNKKKERLAKISEEIIQCYDHPPGLHLRQQTSKLKAEER